MNKSYELRVRIRPPRIAVLLTTNTTIDDYLKAINFLSMVWGGKYARLIFLDMYSKNPLEEMRNEFKSFFPEVVVFPSSQEQRFLHDIAGVCCPKIVNIGEKLFKDFNEYNIGGLIPWHRFHRQEIRAYPNLRRNNLFFLKIDCPTELVPFVATNFGLLPDELLEVLPKSLNAELHQTTVSSFYCLFNLCSLMVKHLSWLDYLNKDLSIISSPWYPSTIILVGNKQPLKDLALFWNLRETLAPGGAENSLLLFPESEIENSQSIEYLAKTISSSSIKSNYCIIRSAECSANILQQLAKRLRPRLLRIKKSTFHIEISERFLAPNIYCYEKEKILTLSIYNQIATVPYQNCGIQSLSHSAAWYCDFVRDEATNRYPFELALPKNIETFKLLNLPASIFGNFRELISFSDECISLEFINDKRSHSLRFQLPSEREFFEVIISRGQYQLKKDEKNIRYTQALKLFGGLSASSMALTGKSWSIIEALCSEPLTYDKLQGKAKIGKNKSNLKLPPISEILLQPLNGILRSIAERRMKEGILQAGIDLLTETPTAERTLESLMKAEIIFRKWLLNRCTSCEREYWVDQIDISTSIHCPGCRQQIFLGDSVNLGYQINKLVDLAIKEGFRPVVLTAQFLEKLTSYGFFWLPGAKIKKDELHTDIDILACADSILIAAECKDLSKLNINNYSKICDSIIEQLKNPILVAKSCGFEIFVLSSFIEEYPKKFKEKISAIAGASLKLLFLTRKDLETGYRYEKDDQGQQHRLTISDICISQRVHKGRRNQKSTRNRWVGL